MSARRVAWGFVVAALVLAVAWDFAAATTFLGDDYIFRAFARLEANPWLAFVADKHGGEYYRPLPMLLWWGLERLSGGRTWAFALVGFLLHALCAVLVIRVGRALRFPSRSALLAGLLFFVSPAQREAALWFSASTDLLGLAFMLGSLVGMLSRARWVRAASVLLAGAAFLCKESALILPVLLIAALWFRARALPGQSITLRRCLLSVLPHIAIAFLYLAARFAVLSGVGGAGDPVAPWWGRGIQLLAGLVHAITAYAPLPEWAAWLAGSAILVWATVTTLRRNPAAGFAIVWVTVALAPLPLAGWVVGARYFYAPAVGLFLLLGLALEATRGWVSAIAVFGLLGLGVATGHDRATQVSLYRNALAVAREAIADGSAKGHRLFLVRGAVKDLDLAIKLSAGVPLSLRSAVVIPDVPASFIWMPPDLADRLDFLLARPALPPSGAYRFGDARLVGLARREEAPDLDEVLDRLPELRILRLGRESGQFVVEDRTESYRRVRE